MYHHGRLTFFTWRSYGDWVQAISRCQGDQEPSPPQPEDELVQVRGIGSAILLPK